MAAPKRKTVTAGSMIRRGGMTNFVRAVRFAARYGEAVDALGSLCTLEQYREFRGMSQAQAYKEQVAWRRCVPDRSVVEVLSEVSLKEKGLTEDDRIAAIADWLSEP